MIIQVGTMCRPSEFLVALLLFAACGSAFNNECGGGVISPGGTVPSGDITILYGEPLELFCILNPEHPDARGYNASNLHFIKGNERIGENLLTIINETTLRLYDPNPAKSYSIYSCQLRHSDGNMIGVCNNNVAVDMELQPVDNFRCLSLNWDNLTCTWSPPPNVFKVKYSLNFRLPGRPGTGLAFQCPNVTYDTDTKNYSCFWSLHTTPMYRQSFSFYYFILTGYSAFKNVTQYINFNHFANVKPSPVSLSLINQTQHEAFIKWMIPLPMSNFPSALKHRVVYHSEYGHQFQPVDISHLSPKKSKYTLRLPNLPFANCLYDVRISIRTEEAFEEQMWSDNATLVFRTLAEPPARPPKTDIGSFEVTPSIKHRNVTVYWWQLEPSEENGINFNYTVDVFVEGERLPVTPTVSKKGYVQYHGLPFKSLRFSIASINREGASDTKSSLVIPQELLPEPLSFTKTAFENITYELSWKPPNINSSQVESYTIFWCDNTKDRPYQCEGRLRWKRVDPHITSINHTVSDDKIYQFAISANGYGRSSGMVWASCTIIPNRPIGKIKELWVKNLGSTFLEITWRLECSDNGVIKGYRIFYCPICGPENSTCCEPERNVTVLKSAHTYQKSDKLLSYTPLASEASSVGNLTGLRPYTTYAIQVSIIAKHEVGPQSERVFSTTGEGIPDPPNNVSISQISTTSMLVSWEPPLRLNGVLQFYRIFYPTSDGKMNVEQLERRFLNYTEITLTNLTGYTNYTVYVTTCARECSEPSEKLDVRTAIYKPGPVNEVRLSKTSTTEQQVKWNPPLLASGLIDYYEIKVVKVGEQNDTILYNETLTTVTITDEFCQEDGVTAYLYSVRAHNVDNDPEHGVAAFSHHDRVKISRRPAHDQLIDYAGPWSNIAENTCTLPQQRLTLIVGGLVIVFFLCICGFFGKCCWTKWKDMTSINANLPDGLDTVPKDSKYPLGNLILGENEKDYPTATADQERLLEALPNHSLPADESGFSATTTATSLSGGSSRHAASPTPSWIGRRGWQNEDYASDADNTPTDGNPPYISFSKEVTPLVANNSATDGYVQATMLNPPYQKDSVQPSDGYVQATMLDTQSKDPTNGYVQATTLNTQQKIPTPSNEGYVQPSMLNAPYKEPVRTSNGYIQATMLNPQQKDPPHATDGYVQATMVNPLHKDLHTTTNGYVQATVPNPRQKNSHSDAHFEPSPLCVKVAPNTLSNSGYVTLPPVVPERNTPTSSIAVVPESKQKPRPINYVSPYVTIDDPRIKPKLANVASASFKKDSSGYVSHSDPMCGGAPAAVPQLQPPSPETRPIALVPIRPKGAEEKRMSSNRTEVDTPVSPDYCRFEWEGPIDSPKDLPLDGLSAEEPSSTVRLAPHYVALTPSQ